MRKPNDQACGKCDCHSREFDAERAIKILARRMEHLAKTVADYMAEAPLDRKQRNKNAAAFSNSIRTRTIGGTPSVNRFPECCAVGQIVGSSVEFFCTGVLIHRQLVLTAAHCVDNDDVSPGNLIVALDVDNLFQSLGSAQLIATDLPQVHPDYIRNGAHDLAVLPLRVSTQVKPATLANESETKKVTEVTVVGFGADDPFAENKFGVKNEVAIPVTALRTNKSQNLSAEEGEFRFDSDAEFVGGGNGRDACNGDSGGPVYAVVAGKTKLVGLTARSVRGGLCGDGGVYTRLDAHLDFVRQAAKAAGFVL